MLAYAVQFLRLLTGARIVAVDGKRSQAEACPRVARKDISDGYYDAYSDGRDAGI
jgi:hypothetical protein